MCGLRKWAPWFVLGGFAALYALTSLRGISWQDGGEYQWRVLMNDVPGFAGVARAHPLYIILARAWSNCFAPGARVWAVNLFSGLAMAGALALLFAALRRLTGSLRAALLAVVFLGFAQMAWWMSSMPEVYTLALLFMAGEIYCGVRALSSLHCCRWLMLLFFCNGLHASVHDFAFFDLAVLGPVSLGYLACRSRRSLGKRSVSLCAFASAWCLGVSPLLAMCVREWMATGSIGAMVQSLLFGTDCKSLVLAHGGVRWKLVFVNWGLAAISFVSPLWMLAFARRAADGGKAAVAVPRVAVGTLAALTILHFVFWVRYFVADQATFILPLLLLTSLWLGLGAARYRPSWGRTLSWSAISVSLAVLAPMMLSKALSLNDFGLRRPRPLPGREEFAYWLLPWKMGETSAERYAETARKFLKRGDLLLTDSTVIFPLRAAVAQAGETAEWKAVSWLDRLTREQLLAEMAAASRVYLSSAAYGYTPDDELLLGGDYRFRKEGPFLRVFPRVSKMDRGRHP